MYCKMYVKVCTYVVVYTMSRAAAMYVNLTGQVGRLWLFQLEPWLKEDAIRESEDLGGDDGVGVLKDERARWCKRARGQGKDEKRCLWAGL